MPREVTAYLCEHRCGRRACCDRASVERHEATCFLNPARRSCKTCEHEADGFSYGERDCGSPARGPLYNPLDYFDVSGYDDHSEDCPSAIAVNCYHWEPSKARFPDGVDVPPWEPLPKPEPDEFADF